MRARVAFEAEHDLLFLEDWLGITSLTRVAYLLLSSFRFQFTLLPG